MSIIRTRRTSIAVYNQIKEEGLLSELRFIVYDCLYNHGPLTMKEVTEKLSHIAATSSTPRFAELRDFGVIYEVRERKCRITGRNVIEWDVTDTLPTLMKSETAKKPKKPNPKKKEILDKVVVLGKSVDDKWKNQLREIYVLIDSL